MAMAAVDPSKHLSKDRKKFTKWRIWENEIKESSEVTGTATF